MKKLILLFVLFLFPIIVCADVYTSTTLTTDENLYADYHLTAGGDMEVNIDGLNFNQEINKLNEGIGNAGIEMPYIFRRIYELWMEWDLSKRGFNPVSMEDLEPIEQKTRYVFDTYFVPRSELYRIINQQQNQIINLQLEIKAIHEILQPSQDGSYENDDIDIFCDAKLKVAKFYNISSVKCNGITYYNHIEGSEFIGIEQLESEPVIQEEEPEETDNTEECSELVFSGITDHTMRLQLNQLISIYNRQDWRGLDLYIELVPPEVKESYLNYIDCISQEGG